MAEGTVQQPADPENPKITGLGTNSNIRGITHRYPRPGASKLCQRATYAEKGGGDSRPAKASQPVEKSFRPGYPRDAWRRYPQKPDFCYLARPELAMAMSPVNLLGEDLSLWNEYRSGNADAFAELIRVHYPDLLHYGTRFTRDTGLVKDCLQDLFMELWINRESICGTSFVRYYLLRSLRRKLARKLGRSRYTGSWEDLNFESVFNGAVAPASGPAREEELA